MLRILLFLALICTYALASIPEDAKQKRSIIDNNGWIGLSGFYGSGHPWPSIDHIPWKELNLHAGLHLTSTLPTYGKGNIALTSEILPKTLPVTKHVMLEKPIPIPEPVIIEKPYHVPILIEKIIHKPVPVSVPVPQAVPITMEQPVPIPAKQPVPIPTEQSVPIPVKQPIAVPVHQPCPVPVKHPVPVPVPVSVPIPPSPPPLSPLLPLPLIPAADLPDDICARDHAPGHLHVPSYHPPSNGYLQLDHGVAALPYDSFDHVLGVDFGHVLTHGYDAYADHLVHGHGHKKRKTNKN